MKRCCKCPMLWSVPEHPPAHSNTADSLFMSNCDLRPSEPVSIATRQYCVCDGCVHWSGLRVSGQSLQRQSGRSFSNRHQIGRPRQRRRSFERVRARPLLPVHGVFPPSEALPSVSAWQPLAVPSSSSEQENTSMTLSLLKLNRLSANFLVTSCCRTHFWYTRVLSWKPD